MLGVVDRASADGRWFSETPRKTSKDGLVVTLPGTDIKRIKQGLDGYPQNNACGKLIPSVCSDVGTGGTGGPVV